MNRPQFAFPAPPDGFRWQPCVYQFSENNVPSFASIALTSGQQTGHIPLRLDHDAPFILMGIKIQNAGVNVLLSDPFGNELTDDFVEPSEYGSDLPPFTVLEGPGIEVPAGAIFQVRLQGQ